MLDFHKSLHRAYTDFCLLCFFREIEREELTCRDVSGSFPRYKSEDFTKCVIASNSFRPPELWWTKRTVAQVFNSNSDPRKEVKPQWDSAGTLLDRAISNLGDLSLTLQTDSSV